MSRGVKQLIYGVAFLLFWALVGLAIYSIFIYRAPSCTDKIKNQTEEGIDCGKVCGNICFPSNFEPISLVDDIDLLSLGGGRWSLLAKIKNSNNNFGASSFKYVFSVEDASHRVISQLNGESFIYGNEEKYLVLPNLDFSKEKPVSAKLEISDPKWLSEKDFLKPKLKLQNKSISIADKKIRVEGVVQNEGSLTLSKVKIVAIFYGKVKERPLGVSEVEVNNINPQEMKSFFVIHPYLEGMDVNQTEVYLSGLR
jgi:hypothetical protein